MPLPSFWKRITGKLDVLRIEPFIALSNHEQLFIKARIISAYRQPLPQANHSWIANLFAAVRRYSIRVFANAEAEVQIGNSTYPTVSDEDGILTLTCVDSNPQIEEISFHVNNLPKGYDFEQSTCRIVRMNPQEAVISDIDDTVLISHATTLGKKLWLSISKNAYTRRPLPGISRFYEQLTNRGKFPVFYVSSSDWSLHALISNFLEYRNIPSGPLFLKDRHVHLRNFWKSGGGSHNHKLDKLHFLFNFFPNTRFFLLGDSGQQDPQIYAQLYPEYKARILGVFIRIINPSKDEAEQRSEFESLPRFHFIKNTDQGMNLAEKYITQLQPHEYVFGR